MKPFVHWVLLHPDTHFLDPLVHRQKVKRIPHLRIVTMIVVVIGTTFCYAYGIDIKKITNVIFSAQKTEILM